MKIKFSVKGFKPNYPGFRRARTLPRTMRLLGDAAKSIARSANSGAGVDGYVATKPEALKRGRGRGRAAVIASSAEAKRAESRRHHLVIASR